MRTSLARLGKGFGELATVRGTTRLEHAHDLLIKGTFKANSQYGQLYIEAYYIIRITFQIPFIAI